MSERRKHSLVAVPAAAVCFVVGLAPAGAEAAPGTPPERPLHGVLLQVTDRGCVVSLGTDDGLACGQRLWIDDSRRPDCLRVVQVSPGTCVASVSVPEARARLVVGDPVTTRKPAPGAEAAPPRTSGSERTSAAGRRKGPRDKGDRRAVVVRVRGGKIWLSGGGDEGIYRGMIGVVKGRGETAVRLVVTASERNSAVARPVDPTAFTRVVVGDEVVGLALPVQERVGALEKVSAREAAERETQVFPSASSTQGSTGLINIPIAQTVPDGALKVGYLQTEGYNPLTRSQGKLRVSYLTVGFLPGLEITGRLTRRALAPTSSRIDKLDRSANVRLQLFPETQYAPAMALGMDDVAGNKLNRAAYVVGSKRFGESRVHLGYGRDRLDGVFIGAERRLSTSTTAMAEWDTSQVNTGLHVRWSDHVDVAAYLLDLDTLRLGVSYASLLGDRDESKYPCPNTEIHPLAGTSTDWPTVIEGIQKALVADDFEDVSVRVGESRNERFPGTTVVVGYTDRTRPRTPLAGLTEALRLVATHCPENIRTMQLVVKSRDVPTLFFTTRLDDYVKFAHFAVSPEMYRERIDVSVADPLASKKAATEFAELAAGGHPGSPSYFRTDISVTPVFHYDLGHASDIVRTQMNLAADIDMLVAKGTVLETELARSLWNEFHQVSMREDLHVRRADLRHTRRLGDRTFGQAALGYLTERTYGLSGELLHVRDHGRASLGVQAQALGDTFTHWRHRSALGDFRYRFPNLDLTASLKYGRFLGGDQGFELALDRRLGNHRMGIVGADTDYRSYGGVRFTFPMGPTRYSSPKPARVHFGDRFAWSYQSNVEGDRGKKLVTGRELEQTLMHDERLYPPFVLKHLERLRNFGAASR